MCNCRVSSTLNGAFDCQVFRIVGESMCYGSQIIYQYTYIIVGVGFRKVVDLKVFIIMNVE